VPFLVFLIFAMMQKRTSKKRLFYNKMGLLVSTSYLALTFLLKWLAFSQFHSALKNQDIDYLQIDTRPSPLNTVLWSANIETEDAYLLGNYSFFDTQPITFENYPKNHQLLGNLVNEEPVKRMIAISEGWYTITEKDESLYFNDLRFGLLSLEPQSQNFVFQYKIDVDKRGKVQFIEEPKNQRDGKKLLSELWTRIKGN
jgi:inner membrane protein